MLKSGNKPPENRIHLFDPVALINDSYGGYKGSNYAVRPRRPTTKSYDDSFADTNNPAGVRSYDNSFTDTNSTVGVISYNDSYTDTKTIGGGLRSYDIGFSTENSTKDSTNGGGLRLRVQTTEEDESDISTPRLWKPSSPTSPNHHNYHTMSPSSRTQAIAKGRRELMEMVRDLPESFYELSLKDIVENKPELEAQKEIKINLPEEKRTPVKETTKQKRSTSKKVKKSESKKKMVRSRSVDNGRFLLKTSVFPVFLGSKKSKKNMGGSSSFKIAPMPKPQVTATGSMKGVEKDWWRRRSCISSESDQSNGLSSSISASSGSSSSSSRSSSINGRRSKRFLPSCCFFNGRRIRGRT